MYRNDHQARSTCPSATSVMTPAAAPALLAAPSSATVTTAVATTFAPTAFAAMLPATRSWSVREAGLRLSLCGAAGNGGKRGVNPQVVCGIPGSSCLADNHLRGFAPGYERASDPRRGSGP